MNIFQYWYDLYKAWKRDETRIAPRDVKGRVYQKWVRTQDIAGLLSTGKFKGSIRPTRIYIAAENQWYDLDEDGRRSIRKVSLINRIRRKK